MVNRYFSDEPIDRDPRKSMDPPEFQTSDPNKAAYVGLWKLRNYRPFDWQVEAEELVETTSARYISLNIGRGAGKTTLFSQLAWAGAIEETHDGLGPPYVPIFADTYEHGMQIFDTLIAEARGRLAVIVDSIDMERHIITLKREAGGGAMQLLSADNPRAMTGHNKTTRALSDESQFISDESFKQFDPSLNIRKAKLISAGVCQGVGQYRTNSMKGFDTEDHPNYVSLRFDSRVNPYFTEDDWNFRKSELSPDLFTQLYEARWTQGDGSVFENIDNCIIGSVVLFLELGKPLIIEPPKPGHEYIAGVDIAKQRDFMAVTIADRWTGRVVAVLRANKRTYSFLEALVADLLVKYGARTWIDETGAGIPVVEHLVSMVRQRYADMKELPERRVAFFPEQLQIGRKTQIIDHLAMALIGERVRFPNIKVLVNELRIYEKTITSTGVVRMSAPVGLHDDMVIALALMAQGLPSPGAKQRPPGFDNSRHGGWEKL